MENKKNVRIEEGDFFNEDEKNLKHKIMRELISVMENNINSMPELVRDFDKLQIMICSIVYMFSRDSLEIIYGAIGFENLNIKKAKLAYIELLSRAFDEMVMRNTKKNPIEH